MEYCVVGADVGSIVSRDVSKTTQDLSARVGELIADGWRPQGGVASVQAGAGIYLLQAMTRQEG